MAKRTGSKTPSIETAEIPASPPPLDGPDKQLADLAELVRHMGGVSHAQMSPLVADALKRIAAIRASLD